MGRNERRTFWYAACCLLPLSLLGCARKTDGAVDIHGKVSFQGKAIEKGTVSFVPEDGRSNAVVADIKNGQYSVRLGPGGKKVQISSMKKTGERQAMVAGESRKVNVTQETIPEKYNVNSTLRIEVPATSGKDFNFDL
jgi:hypothetical protein